MTEEEQIIRRELSKRVIITDTDYAPDVADDVQLRAPEGDEPEEFMVVYTTSKDSNDLALSILPINEYTLNLVNVNNLTVVARGSSNISLTSLSYGLQHSTRLLYKSFAQDVNAFYMNHAYGRFESDDKLLRTELNKLQ